jgi:hypothetical protein
MVTAHSAKSGIYSVGVDKSIPSVIDGFSNTQSASCGFGWSAANLQNAVHTVVITTLGQSSNSAANSAPNGASNFEVDGFV